VRWNATRHGISSPEPVVLGLEKREDWEEHRNGILENLSPVGHLEVTLAERIAVLSWRLHRVTRYETEAISLSQQKIEDDIHDRNRILRSLRESPSSLPRTGCGQEAQRAGCHLRHMERAHDRQEADRRGDR
jgi:DNA gyrase/topoisomerase IV subunit A